MNSLRYYAYRHKASGRWVSAQPYLAKAPATSSLYETIRWGSAPYQPAKWPNKAECREIAKRDYELVVFRLEEVVA